MTTHQRRGRSPTAYAGSTNDGSGHDDDDDTYGAGRVVESMDEDDQKALIEKLRNQAMNQQVFFQQLFGYGVGGFGVVLSLALPIICQEECQFMQIECWSHSFISLGLHILAVYPFVVGTTPTPTTTARDNHARKFQQKMIGVVSQLLPFIVWLLGWFGDDRDHFHLSLLIGNAITFFGHHFIMWDIESTNKAICDLEKAQYNHKSL
mmetsp:Transcript_2494/g.5434  ORF Transcript_2494/g.5434 Transcript_2494/m.5434 type:complete len:207 (+) Transcript_2494:97-717(+)|eukprot:CAMPEP_0113483780 /NCGR_PEP_ID=MMETSP0014_2-20120614/23612_1 /TAXON_ID=2857 /ORGANISM="Nitzschia sp." /LENGTH=206 /DNA_ID=CAMNT_0000377341 /DNA_START=39 /DNA_END=659 /DNA_ORIENTATION=- /assembly_acc=CAM_ASM_000159